MLDTAQTDEGVVADALASYRSNSHDPAAVTDLFTQIWKLRGERIGAAIEVPPCPYTSAELAALDAAGRRPSFMPPQLATQQSRPELGTIFPLLDDFALLPDNSVINPVEYAGWFDCEVQIEMPGGFNQPELIAVLEERGHSLITLNQYIVASEDSKLLTGRWFDEGQGWSRIGSTSDGRLVAARYDGKEPIGVNVDEVHVEGCVCVAYDVAPKDTGVALGARTTTRFGEAAPLATVTYHKPVLAPPTITDLDAEWNRIVDVYLELGFHTRLGLSAEEYKTSLPKFAPQPDSYRGRFDVPLIVETRVPWDEFGIRKTGFVPLPFEPVDARHATPEQPYTGWFTAWGQRFPEGISPTDGIGQLADDELGANPHELMAMETAYPELNTSGRYWDAIGSSLPPTGIFGIDDEVGVYTRYMGMWRPRGVPEVAVNLNPFAYTFFRPLVRGTEISTLTAEVSA